MSPNIGKHSLPRRGHTLNKPYPIFQRVTESAESLPKFCRKSAEFCRICRMAKPADTFALEIQTNEGFRNESLLPDQLHPSGGQGDGPLGALRTFLAWDSFSAEFCTFHVAHFDLCSTLLGVPGHCYNIQSVRIEALWTRMHFGSITMASAQRLWAGEHFFCRFCSFLQIFCRFCRKYAKRCNFFSLIENSADLGFLAVLSSYKILW